MRDIKTGNVIFPSLFPSLLVAYPHAQRA
jgi:hypothetical protein